MDTQKVVGEHPYNWHKKHKKNLTVGQRAADHLRNLMGSWRFIFGFLIFMAIWALLNSVAWFFHWDVYPFILLNLFLSMLAGLQGGILLIASKRQDEISAVLAEHDYRTNVQAEQEIREVKEMHKESNKKLDEILAIVKGKKV